MLEPTRSAGLPPSSRLGAKSVGPDGTERARETGRPQVQRPSRPPPTSNTAKKARAQRLERLQWGLDYYLERPAATLETLMSELEFGEQHPSFWEGLHAAAIRDRKVDQMASAYEKVTVHRRLRNLAPADRAIVLEHAANYFQGIVGDPEMAEHFLWRVLEEVPNHADALDRLERSFTVARCRVGLVELYALVAIDPPRPPAIIAKLAINIISVLPSQSVLPDNACHELLVLLPANPLLISALETHCRKTGQFALACELLERSLTIYTESESEEVERRCRLIDLYLGDAADPEKAISHVEILLEKDPCNETARPAAERLLRFPSVASRATAALQTARRQLHQSG